MTDEIKNKKIEENLHSSSLYARSLIEASLDPLVTISVDGKITDVNKATEVVTGCPRDKLIGSDFSDYFTEPEKARAGYKEAFTKGFVRDYPLAICHKTGKITDVLYNATVYKNEKGEIQGVFAAARDITERKNAERLAAIGATAGMVGHDIRNPLQTIAGEVFLAQGALDSLPDGESKTSLRESLDIIERQIEYVNKIVQDLQDFAKPIKPILKEIDLENLCEELLSKTIVPENVSVSCQVEPDARQLLSDPEIIKRVMVNLVTNAVQAMPEGGKLCVRAYQDRGDTILAVDDTGCGIPKDVSTKLFTPLFTTKAKGQGFGLAVVKRMTDALGGTVTFESEVGKGTKFFIRLPKTKSD